MGEPGVITIDGYGLDADLEALLNNQDRRLATVAAPKENSAIIASRGKTPSNQLPCI
ncbi:MAG: hypothetical protein V7L22_02385 [Nostoc sp.]|uniref:hypothetical protein n=1 Tax=Nostoc sp. TaxID=1180 RepID=UPI002FFA1784